MTPTQAPRDPLVMRKNRQLATLLALVVASGLAVAYAARFVLWHIVFAK